jgi:hypothetical protein
VNQSRFAEEMTDYAYYKATPPFGGFFSAPGHLKKFFKNLLTLEV